MTSQWTDDSTIVALATPQGEGGLAVVRLSGPRAVEIAGAVFPWRRFVAGPESHRALHGELVWPPTTGESSTTNMHERSVGTPIDTAVVLPMLAPHSYTGEDTVEFFCHGGRMPAQLVVEACLLAGAVPAGRGEFTRRAFLNGKLSLDQAEAVVDLIHAEDELSARAALRQLQGGFDAQIRAIEEPLRDILARIEGTLEFSEEEDIRIERSEIERVFDRVLSQLDDLLALAPAGRQLREGVHVVLLGSANVGKSSLLNRLVGFDRVLVDHEAGTTRDVVEVPVNRDGTTYILHDTAGLRDTDGRVEKMGIELTRRSVRRADIVLLLSEYGNGNVGSDGTWSATNDREPTTGASGKRDNNELTIDRVRLDLPPESKIVHICTKSDLLTTRDRETWRQMAEQIPVAVAGAILTSSETGEGVESIWSRLFQVAARDGLREAIEHGVVLNDRHVSKLRRCRDGIASLRRDLDTHLASADASVDASNDVPDEVLGSLLAVVVAELGEVSGRVYSEKILEEIFARFCIGK